MNKAIQDLIRAALLYRVWLHQAYHVLSAKYKRTILGTLWIAGNFVVVSIAITIVFGTLFQKDLKEFLPYAMLGNLAGQLVLWPVSSGPELYVSQGHIIRNHAYPFSYFPMERIAGELMLFGHNLIVFFIFMAFNGTLTVPHWSLIFGLIILVLFFFSWGTLIGMMGARFRDIRFLLPPMGFFLYFLTPIYWNVELLRDRQWIADINPIYAMVSLIRIPLMGQMPTAHNWTMAIGVTALGLLLWAIFFSTFRRRIPFWV